MLKDGGEVMGDYVGIFGVLSGFIISFIMMRRGNAKDIEEKAIDREEKAAEKADIKTKLDIIGKGVMEIQVDLKAHELKVNSLTGDLIRVEESVKSAHHRIDKVEKTVEKKVGE